MYGRQSWLVAGLPFFDHIPIECKVVCTLQYRFTCVFSMKFRAIDFSDFIAAIVRKCFIASAVGYDLLGSRLRSDDGDPEVVPCVLQRDFRRAIHIGIRRSTRPVVTEEWQKAPSYLEHDGIGDVEIIPNIHYRMLSATMALRFSERTLSSASPSETKVTLVCDVINHLLKKGRLIAKLLSKSATLRRVSRPMKPQHDSSPALVNLRCALSWKGQLRAQIIVSVPRHFPLSPLHPDRRALRWNTQLFVSEAAVR